MFCVEKSIYAFGIYQIIYSILFHLLYFPKNRYLRKTMKNLLQREMFFIYSVYIISFLSFYETSGFTTEEDS